MKAIQRAALGAAALVCLYPGAALGAQHSSAPWNEAEWSQPTLRIRAADLRVTFNRLLGEHAYLTIQAMRTGVKGGADFAAAGEALEANTSELEGIIEGVYGAEAARAFGDLWRSHIGYIVDYTVAVGKRDEGQKDRAEAGMAQYRVDLSAFLASANPNLTEEGVSGLLAEHIGQLQQLASYATGDYDRAYSSARHTYAHMFTVGDALSAAIAAQFPTEFPGQDVARSPALDLRVALDRLLGEHTFLSVEAMRAGLGGGPEFEAATGALDANSADLTAAVAQVYGEDAGRTFGELWRTHIGYYIDYIRAVEAADGPARQAALDQLRDYAATFANFLAGANPHLPADQVADLLGQHIDHLVAQVNAYDARDYSTAYAIGREAYGHILSVSDALALAIATQFPDVFPGLPATSTEPAGPTSAELRWLIILVAPALLMASHVFRDRRAQGG